ncbi:hypothetical protein Tco_1292057 [Tanacetum coccineum]
MSISSIKRIIIRNGDIRWRRREFDSLELALKSLLEGRGEGDESIEMSRFSTDSPRSDSASKRINSGGIEWMLPDSSLIRIYLSRSHFFIKIKERIREKMLNFSFGMSLGKNDSSLKVKSYRYRSEGLEESPLGLAKLPCSIGSRRLFIEEKLPGKLSSKGWIATTVKAVVADAVGKGTNAVEEREEKQAFNVMSKKFYNSIMKDKVEYKGKNIVGAFMNVPIFVRNVSIVTHFAVVENMDRYRDQDMGDVIFGEPFCKASCVEARRFDMGVVIFGEPFCKASCVEARRFDRLITIHNGNDNVTYQMDLARKKSTKLVKYRSSSGILFVL